MRVEYLSFSFSEFPARACRLRVKTPELEGARVHACDQIGACV
jgi:hypothetical protein